MKKAGIVLLVVQVLALLGGAASGQLADRFAISGGYDVGRVVGFFLPAIIGIVLLVLSGRKK